MSTANKQIHCTYCGHLNVKGKFNFLGKDDKAKLITQIISNYNGRKNENCFVTYENDSKTE